MSAYIVSTEHIHALVAAALEHHRQLPFRWYPNIVGSHSLDYTNADEVGAMLLSECVRSVSYRYPDDTFETLPGPNPKTHPDLYLWRRPMRMPTTVEALKQIDCYEYQSCEHPEWETSSAREFCAMLRRRLVQQLPGYDEAPWGWD